MRIEGESSKTFKNVEGLDETMKDKTREFGKNARLTVLKIYKAEEIAKEAKAQADSINSKVNDIENQYENNLGKFAVAIDSRFEKHRGELKDEYAQFRKQP